MMRFSVILIMVVFLSSCHRDSEMITAQEDHTSVDSTDFEKLDIPESFDFSTIATYKINLSYLDDQNKVISKIPFQIIDSNDPLIKAGNIYYRGVSHMEEKTAVSLHIPTYIETVYLETLLPGYAESVPIELDRSEIDIVIGGMPAKSTKSSQANSAFQAGGFTYTSTYNEKGGPDDFTYVPIPYPNYLVMFNSFPEGKPLYDIFPNYFEANRPSDIAFVSDGDATVRFVHEGAGYKNTLGYFYFDSDKPPHSKDEIEEYFILFPNASYYNSGGDLRSGYRTRLYYRNEVGELQKTFPGGVTVSFFLIANGWDPDKKEVLNENRDIWYSFNDFNSESDPDMRKHIVTLRDDVRSSFMIGIEDVNREAWNCDQDFNDVLFYVEASPYTSIDLSRYESVVESNNDADGDGILDAHDDYPNDPTKAFDYYFPSKNLHNTIVFEDLWPSLGDFDCNDMVIDYMLKFVISPSDKIVESEMSFSLKATGASVDNGFGLVLPFDRDNIVSVTGMELTENMISLDGNGLEAGNSDAVCIVFDNSHKHLYSEKGDIINTNPNSPSVDPKDFTIKIDLKTPVSRSVLGEKFFNPFIFIDQDRGRELHLKGYSPTDQLNTIYFGTEDDKSTIDFPYVGTMSLPWGLLISTEFDYPKESTSLTDAYLHFVEWCMSNGEQYSDWMLPKEGYRNLKDIYSK